MKEIPLTKGKVAIVDDEDYTELINYSWRYQNGYAARTTCRDEGKRTTVLMHRQILSDSPKNMDIDHINGNKSDNRKSNLRIATRKQNMHNSPKRKCNKSGYKGVSYDNVKKKWRSRFRYQNRELWLGYYDNKHDAARIYNFWANDLFGEYARLNEINGKRMEVVV